VAHKWGNFGKSFDGFLSEFGRYIREYYTKNYILTNYMKLIENEDFLLYQLSTPSIDILIKIFKPDRVIMDSYFTDAWMGGENHIFNDWNGMVLTEEQYQKFVSLAREIYEYYEKNRFEFEKARAEAFANLVIATKGKALEVFVDALSKAKRERDGCE